MATLNFDANQVEPSAGREPIPAGKYVAAIVRSEMKPTRNGTGQYLELEYQIIDGEHRGRKLWSRHTLHHPNAQTVQIARGELSAICRACGVMQPGDSRELHDRPMTILVRLRRREDSDEMNNEVVTWGRKEVATDMPQQIGAVGTSATPPWLKR